MKRLIGRLLFLSWILSLSFCTIHKQTVALDDGSRNLLPAALHTGKLEFSSMAWYHNELLLVPQYPDRFNGEIYSISRQAIRRGIVSEIVSQHYTARKVEGLQELITKIGSTYEGFEATVVTGDRIYFTIECGEKNADCYLVSGVIHPDRIVLDTQGIIALPKLKRLSNAGYESLAWWPQKKELIAFFEYNKADVSPRAWLLHPPLAGNKVHSVSIPPLPFRLTDMIYAPKKGTGGSFIGVNFSYNGEKEYREYVGNDSVVTDEPSLAGKKLRNTTYVRLMRLSVDKRQTFMWRKERDITFKSENWEGIALFKNGVLLITDEYPGSVLKWFRLPGGR